MIPVAHTTTTTALLEGLFDSGNDAVWREFDARYHPIIIGFCCKLGLSDADAADVAQETLLRFVKEYRAGKYDRTKGRLRSWIIGIAKYRVADLNRQIARRREHRGESAFAELSDEDELKRIWDEECRNAILRNGMTELQENTKLDPRTLDAFKRLVFGQVAPAEVAAEMGMSVDAVYKAKQRCLEQLRSITARLTEVYEVEEE